MCTEKRVNYAWHTILSSHRIQGPLPKGKFMSFFSLLKHIFELLHDQKGELNKVEPACDVINLWLALIKSDWRTIYVALILGPLAFRRYLHTVKP